MGRPLLTTVRRSDDVVATSRRDFAVFVSHSLAWGDELLFAQLCCQLRRYHGLVCHVARRKLEGPTTAELEDAIGSMDCVLVMVTNDGTATRDVIREIDVARAMRTPVIGIAEKSARLSPLLEKIPDLLVVSFGSPGNFTGDLYLRLLTLGSEKHATAAFFWIVLAVLGEIYASREFSFDPPEMVRENMLEALTQRVKH